MSFFTGNPHHSGAQDGSGQPLTPHEVRSAGQTPPHPPRAHGPEAAPAGPPVRTRRPRKGLLGGMFSLGTIAYLVPDDDPWRRERWRLLGQMPDVV